MWRSIAAASLVGIGLAESAGGAGLGFLETCIVLEEVGRTAAPVPALAVMALGGDLCGVADGSRIVTAVPVEPVGDPRTPTTTTHGARLIGEKVCVPAGLVADTFVVSADDGLYVVAAGAPGLTVEREDTTSGVREARLVLDGVAATRLAGPEATDELVERAQPATAVMMSACATPPCASRPTTPRPMSSSTGQSRRSRR